jgi:16S rRNA (guanine527-N7)-methyltransferase
MRLLTLQSIRIDPCKSVTRSSPETLNNIRNCRALASPILEPVPSSVRMHTARIADLLAPYATLGESQLQQISTYIDVLRKWNVRTNLTAIRDPEDIVTRHFGESFFAAGFLLRDVPQGFTVIDVGSGAGFPGIPFKLFAPHITLTLIESHNKKAIFLREVIRALELSNAHVISARAEHVTETADLVTMRAVERFESILPDLPRLVRPGGRLGLLVGERQLEPAQRLVPGTWTTSEPVPATSGRIVAQWESAAI